MRERYRRPEWVRRFNAMADACGGAERVVPLVADHFLEHAVTATGLEFGDLGDGDWENRFRRLVEAVNLSDLHVVGRLHRHSGQRAVMTSASCGPRRYGAIE